MNHRNIAGGARVGLRRITAGTLALCVFSIGVSAPAREPRVELGAYGGYMMGGSVEGDSDLVRTEAEIESAPSYGATLDLLLRPGAWAEISYARQETELSLRTTTFDTGTETARYDLTVQYLQIGGLLEFRVPNVEWLRPTIGATIGATVYSAEDNGYDVDEWRLSVLLEGGAKLKLHQHFGLRLRARLLTTLLPEDSAIFCGGIAGCAVVYAGTAVFQGEFSAGAYLAF